VIRVLGLGNVLMSDDGLGPYVVRVLEAAYECPPGVEFIDAGTPGLDLTPYLLGARAVIFVDTVSSKGQPGEVRVYARDEILKYPPQTRTGPHDPALKEALLRVAAVDGGPADVALIGVIPHWVATGTALSPAVQEAVPRAVGAVVEALTRLGRPPRLRATPMPPDVWWCQGPPGLAAPGVGEEKFPHPAAK
jgi:hydrogenase maturation protease